jgi:DNA-binding HxlR family transcriptional regulator
VGHAGAGVSNQAEGLPGTNPGAGGQGCDLTQTLRELERDGLVRRTVYPEVPVRVVYALTDAGRTLCEPLRALQEWAVAHLGDVTASQETYDRAD